MLLKGVSYKFFAFNCRLRNKFYIKQNLILFEKLMIENRIKSQKFSDLNVRSFSDQKTDDSNQRSNEMKLKPIIEKQNEISLKIRAEKMSKTNEFFYIILKKPNELMEWMANTSTEKKKNIIFSSIIKYLIKPLGIISSLIVVFVFANSDTNEITGRKCVYSIPVQMVGELESDVFKKIFDDNMKSGSFVPSTDPLVKRLDKCFNKLIESNKDLDVIGDGIWSPIVINDDNICDIIILKESRNVFVYKKMFDLCETDDELAYVLAHQLSHTMLDHMREVATYAPIYLKPFLALLPRIWLLGKDPLLSIDLFSKIDRFLENLVKGFVWESLTISPFDEDLEEEADRIAMQLMTRSCFDIRKCRTFCKRHQKLTKNDSQTKVTDKTKEENIEFLRKHPITENKLLYLFQYKKFFIELRKVCNCEPLVSVTE